MRQLTTMNTVKQKELENKVIYITQEELDELNWGEETLLELEEVPGGWIIKQSRVAASKFLGFDNENSNSII